MQIVRRHVAYFAIFTSTARKELKMSANGALTSATPNIGNGTIYRYIYKTGYMWQNNAQSDLTLIRHYFEAALATNITAVACSLRCGACRDPVALSTT